jgi:Tol biopolymer transport system component/tRNA A-37 threonylcarbamoyl transferase component Bud32
MALTNGTKLGPYEIVAPLGAGGMGEVYRARDTRLNRTVAIKTLRRDKVADAKRKKRFLQEARAASALNHPNIVMLYDIANDAGTDYLVMEYVPGKSIDKLITPKGSPLAEVLNYAQQIATGLAAAHAAGIVHGDMKPANVIVTPESQVKILDFGLAKLMDRAPDAEGETQTQEAALPEAGAITGTVAYMSPEQASGRPLDHRADIFSVGVMLYEMLAGSRPMRGKSPVETMSAIIHDPAPPLAAQPPELNDIVDKALAKDPKDRYQHAGDLGLDLRRFQKAWESKSLPSMQGASAPFEQRQKNWSVIGGVAVLLLLAAIGTVWQLARRADAWVNPLENAQFTRLTDFEGSELDAALSPDGKFVAFISDQDGLFDAFIGQVGVGNLINVTKGRFPELYHEQIRSVGFSGDGNELWLRVSRTDPASRTVSDVEPGVWLIPAMGGTPRRFLERANMALWAPDGTRIAYFEPRPGDPIFVADRQGMNPRQIYASRPGEHTHYETWSPDGQYIYFVRGFRSTEMDVWRVPATGGQAERLTHHNSKVTYPAVLDDRTLLYIATAENGAGSWLYAMNLKTRVTHRANLGIEDFISIAASNGPNGPMTRLAATVSNPRGTLWTVPILHSVAHEADAKPMKLPAVRAVSPRYGPNYLLYLSSKGGGDGLWKFQDGASTELWKPTDEVITAPVAISPDGSRICFTVRKGERQHLYLMTAEGTGIRPLAESLDVRDGVSWSPDGKSVVASVDEGLGGRIYRIPVDGGTPERLVEEISYNPVWSPDGRLILYYFAPQGAIFPLRAVTPDKKPFKLPDISSRGEGGRFRFLPDGKSFVVLQGPFRAQNFYLVNVDTGTRRQLTEFKPGSLLRNFDISPDGKQIVFDRTQENSDVVLIDLPKKDQ